MKESELEWVDYGMDEEYFLTAVGDLIYSDLLEDTVTEVHRVMDRRARRREEM